MDFGWMNVQLDGIRWRCGKGQKTSFAGLFKELGAQQNFGGICWVVFYASQKNTRRMWGAEGGSRSGTGDPLRHSKGLSRQNLCNPKLQAYEPID